MATAAEQAPDATQAPAHNIVVDNYEGASSDEANSAYDSELNSYTTSLSSSVEDFKFKHGRRYHAYKEGSYVFPNDDKESDRLDIVHQMMRTCLNNELFLAPIKDPKRILDLGTGTGIWAIETGDHFPNADVLGNDLSPIQPRWVPPNVHFEVDDVEAEWTYSHKFDFIHSRTLYGAIKDWPKLIRQCFENTTPGGYCEFTDFDLLLISPDKSLEEGSPIHYQNSTVHKLLEQAGTDPSPGRSLEKWVRDAGFEDVHVKIMPVPLGTWPKDKRLKEIGSWMWLQLYEGTESFSMYMFTTFMGWSSEQVITLAAGVRKQMKDPKVHSLLNLYNVYGRKPKDSKEGSPTLKP